MLIWLFCFETQTNLTEWMNGDVGGGVDDDLRVEDLDDVLGALSLSHRDRDDHDALISHSSPKGLKLLPDGSSPQLHTGKRMICFFFNFSVSFFRMENEKEIRIRIRITS